MNNQQIINRILDSWYTSIKKVDVLLEKLTEEDFLKEVAPSRSRGIYLIGHLVGVNDLLLPLLTTHSPMYPELKETFLMNSDGPQIEHYTIAKLNDYWTAINTELKKHLDGFSSEEWLQRHNSVSAEDFAKEPHRNRLNAILGRTNHMNYHLGQLNFLLSKS